MEISIRYLPITIRPSAQRSQLASFSLSFAGLVVLARSMNPIPSRTRPLNSSAPMVLWLKPWESRSLPGLPRTRQFLFTCHDKNAAFPYRESGVFVWLEVDVDVPGWLADGRARRKLRLQQLVGLEQRGIAVAPADALRIR